MGKKLGRRGQVCPLKAKKLAYQSLKNITLANQIMEQYALHAPAGWKCETGEFRPLRQALAVAQNSVNPSFFIL